MTGLDDIQDLGEPGGQRYIHAQPGTTIRVILLIASAWLLLFAALMTPVLYPVLVLLLVIMFLFHSLTVQIDTESIGLSFGPGLIRKRIPLSEIVSCRPIRNSWLLGFGIRYVFDGWMWNVSGLDAVQLTFADGRHFRIGTDEPEVLSRAISDAIGK